MVCHSSGSPHYYKYQDSDEDDDDDDAADYDDNGDYVFPSSNPR